MKIKLVMTKIELVSSQINTRGGNYVSVIIHVPLCIVLFKDSY